ncbi:hypothetical protein ACIGEH_19305 [Bacillus altitudinis]|uniref:hypothetical protein n=1 Tax=Bacillus altitudinis TaxID=293387 RepID=UPI0037CC017E
MNKMSKIIVMLIVITLIGTPITVNAQSPTTDYNNIEQTQNNNPDEEITSEKIPPVVIALAIRALLAAGRTELVRYLQQEGIKAYCSKYKKSGPKVVSDLLCK